MRGKHRFLVTCSRLQTNHDDVLYELITLQSQFGSATGMALLNQDETKNIVRIGDDTIPVVSSRYHLVFRTLCHKAAATHQAEQVEPRTIG